MRKGWIFSLIIYIISVAANAPMRDHYIAAVLEHHRLGDPEVNSPEEIITKNLNVFKMAASVAQQKGADIIVFPEFGIFPPRTRDGIKPYLEYIPDPAEVSCNPCNSPNEYANRTILLTLSCLAKNNSLFLVANLRDTQPCSGTDCPEDGAYQFNSNVVFNRDGTLITRYHKVHLFYEDNTDSPRYPQDPVFSTDFGTFATYICFDVWFKDIAESSRRVDNIAFPTMWFNTMPILNSLQVWQEFAITNNVSFLASNVQRPGYGNTGSGIFIPRRGAVKYTLNNDGLSKLVVAKVPLPGSDADLQAENQLSITVISEHNSTNYDDQQEGTNIGPTCDRRIWGFGNNTSLDYRCLHDNTENYTFTKLKAGSDTVRLCQNGMCCSLNYSTEDMKDNFYLGVHNQTYSASGRYFWCLEACLVLRCEEFNNRSCSTFPLESETTFRWLELKANFTTKYVYPSVLKNYLRIATFQEWNHSVEELDSGEMTGQLNYGGGGSSPVVVAALVGRCYDRDPPFVP